MGVKLDFLLEHTIPCVEEVPVCGDTCNKPLACGEHLCIRSCHYGDCGQVCCIMSIKRGRGGRDGTRGYRCTLILLHCGVCVCVCVQCMQTAIKQCRCGKKTKSLPCTTEYLCETKCTKLKQCGIHQCKRKVYHWSAIEERK